MIPLDQDKLRLMVRVSVLHAAAPDVLSAFELDTLWAVNERALKLDLNATTTIEEWAVIETAHAGLVAALKTRVWSYGMDDGRYRLKVMPATPVMDNGYAGIDKHFPRVKGRTKA